MGIANDDLQVLDDGVAWARSHVALLFPNGRVDPMILLSYVMADVLVLGRGECRIVERDGWWVVSSDVDWMAGARDPGRRGAEVPINELFARVVAAPEHGEHSLRAEVLVNAFASDVAVWNGDISVIKGDAPNASWPPCRRALAFRIAQVV